MTAAATGAAILAVIAVTAITRAALSGPVAAPRAESSVTHTPLETLSPEPSPTPPAPPASPSPSPSPVDTATQRPLATPGPGDPVPKTYPGRKSTKFLFANHDPEYDVVFYIGSDRYGPFKPWAKSGWITHETYAGLVFRMEFPKRHNCDDSARPLERPLDDEWGLHAERTYMSHECSSLDVSWAGPDGSGMPQGEPWSFPPDSPSATP